MELLLNLAWLLLAVPAYCLWRDSRYVHARRTITSAQCILALGCALVMLFPVVSATDDLHAMRSEMEESPCGKHSVCQRGSEKPCTGKWHAQPAIASSSFPLIEENRDWLQQPDLPILLFSRTAIVPTGRAPPTTVLG